MCGLYGFFRHGETEVKNLNELTEALAEYSAERGRDATGISFLQNGMLKTQKAAKTAYMMDFKLEDSVTALIGHTRHSTQGSEKNNYNNHPFLGKTKLSSFALAHNGVITNDKKLRKKLKLPKTKIETDSYIAVQLIESKKRLNLNTLKYMAETISGSFSFSVLDSSGSLYLVKGDSPLSIVYFRKLGIYVYASTEEILYKSLIDSSLFGPLKRGEYEEISIAEGEILMILPDGKITRGDFKYTPDYGRCWWDFGSYKNDDYVKSLKEISSYCGYSPEVVDELLSNGFAPEEIEDYFYGEMECEL